MVNDTKLVRVQLVNLGVQDVVDFVLKAALVFLLAPALQGEYLEVFSFHFDCLLELLQVEFLGVVRLLRKLVLVRLSFLRLAAVLNHFDD